MVTLSHQLPPAAARAVGRSSTCCRWTDERITAILPVPPTSTRLSKSADPGRKRRFMAGNRDAGTGMTPRALEPEFGVRDGKYYLTEQQAQAILDLRLQKLTGLEHEKLLDEYKELLERSRTSRQADRLMEVIAGADPRPVRRRTSYRNHRQQR